MLTKSLGAVVLSCALFLPGIVKAGVKCDGTIASVYKWHNMERISILLSSTNRWINMPTDSDEAMALMAFAAKKPVTIHWSPEDVETCMDGWSNNKKLDGYFLVSH